MVVTVFSSGVVKSTTFASGVSVTEVDELLAVVVSARTVELPLRELAESEAVSSAAVWAVTTVSSALYVVSAGISASVSVADAATMAVWP